MTIVELFTDSTHAHTHKHTHTHTHTHTGHIIHRNGTVYLHRMKESAELSVDTVQSGLSWRADACPNSSAVDRGKTYWIPVNL